MRRLIGLLTCALLAITAISTGRTAYPATPAPVATPFDCPITQPNGNDPPPANIGGPGGYGNDVLWASLTMWSDHPGLVEVPNDGHLFPNGWISGMKWMWYRYLRGTLTIEGRRLDASAPPLKAWIPEGYGDIGLQATAITFPTDGCWEIIGTVGDQGSLTFVVQVIYPSGFSPTGTPIPAPTPAWEPSTSS